MTHVKSNRLLIVIGITFLAYAIAGNYVALPGYLRFLERGGTSEAGRDFDMAVAIGAAKTILWMLSFQIGVFCLAVAHARRDGLATRPLAIGLLVWIALWTWPSLPAPGAWFYIGFGSIVMTLLALAILMPAAPGDNRARRTLFVASIVFFAFATWEVCGLGSTGRMLHPEQGATPMAHNILVTQSSKLMIEFLIAWALLLASKALPGWDARSRRSA